jgi:hypothetical protein
MVIAGGRRESALGIGSRLTPASWLAQASCADLLGIDVPECDGTRRAASWRAIQVAGAPVETTALEIEAPGHRDIQIARIVGACMPATGDEWLQETVARSSLTPELVRPHLIAYATHQLLAADDWPAVLGRLGIATTTRHICRALSLGAAGSNARAVGEALSRYAEEHHGVRALQHNENE